MVVARPGGCVLASPVRGSFARLPFTCPGGIPLSSSQGRRYRSRKVARISSLPTRALAPILSAIRIAGHLATPFIPQLTDGLSELAAFRRRDAIEDCIRSAQRVAARRPWAVQHRRPRARTPSGRPDALATRHAQG